MEKRALFPCFYLGLFEGVLSVTTIVHSVPCGWIKLCVRTVVDIWLLSVCKNELLLGKGVKSCMSDVHVFHVRMDCLLDGYMSSWVVS
jgi:hypothetical protein